MCAEGRDWQIPGKSRWTEETAGAQARTGVSQEHAEVSGIECKQQGREGGPEVRAGGRQ